MSNSLQAWGQNGHKVVGALALEHLTTEARRDLYHLLGTSSLEEITQWCIWPDTFRATDDGAWTAPLHYVNIPPETDGYEKTRDCSSDLCVTEAISRFSSELGNVNLPLLQRQEAFGFVCHFVGDLSQPLHAGFAADRGANDVSIVFNGQQLNLHRFWDSSLVDLNSYHWKSLRKILLRNYRMFPRKSWDAEMVVQWTNESHFLAESRAYPENPEITQAFADESWQLVRLQLAKGGRNLATIVNSVLGQR